MARSTDEWPPADGAAFIRSARFGEEVLRQCVALQRRNPGLDFSDAAAEFFEWLDRKLAKDAGFLENPRAFPRASAFWAYARTSLKRVALNTGRKRKRGIGPTMRLDSPMFSLTPDPLAVAERDEIIDRLGLPCADIVKRVLDGDGASLDVYASSIDMDRETLERRFEECLDRLADDPGVRRLRRARGGRRRRPE